MVLLQPTAYNLRWLLHRVKMRLGFLRIMVVPFLGILMFLLLLCLFLRNSLGGRVFENSNSNKIYEVEKAFNEWHKCITARFEEKRDLEELWRNFENLTKMCTTETAVSKIVLTPFQNKDEIKYYVFNRNISNPSVVVSLGIGADITAEIQLKDKLGQAGEFFGADPIIVPNSELFSKIGTFFPFAVSSKTGLVKSEIREDNGSYSEMNAVSINMITFLKDMVNRTVIDHLIMDNEGPEYEIVPMIAIENIMDDNGIVICHMNVEFHAPGPKERLQLFKTVISGVLKAKRFAPLYNLYWGHQRSFFINYDHPYCIEKYLTQFF